MKEGLSTFNDQAVIRSLEGKADQENHQEMINLLWKTLKYPEKYSFKIDKQKDETLRYPIENKGVKFVNKKAEAIASLTIYNTEDNSVTFTTTEPDLASFIYSEYNTLQGLPLDQAGDLLVKDWGNYFTNKNKPVTYH